MENVNELKKLLGAFEDYIIHGSSHRDRLDQLLEKHGFNLLCSIGVIDIFKGFCKRYKVKAYYDKKGILQVKEK